MDTATVWLKRAGVATSAAIAAATRPRPKEPSMTTTPAAPRTATSSDNLTGARPTTGRIPTIGSHGAPRRVRLAISRVDPWSVMKLSFLLSVAIGVMIVVAAAVVWFTLNGLQVFTKADDLVTQITGTESGIDILQYVEFQRIISGATLVAVIDVFLLTALATIGAFLYNIVAALVGGVHVTMTDE
ncbi:membrane protein [Cellulomonas terrae]|uniref:Membrane protein n=2 Tax=Cellulomonas terrae TaxID=311234 RepID=A0A511JPK1_9CELL|nr:membrane protein [Cellulomonas terrae]